MMAGIWHDKKAVIGNINILIKKGLVTIAVHKLSDDIAIGTLKSTLKQAQIDIE